VVNRGGAQCRSTIGRAVEDGTSVRVDGQ
jgi:hypothetical protein